TAQLAAHDQATGRDEVVEILCSAAELASSRTSARVVVQCMRDRDDQPLAFGWTPGHAYVVSGLPGERVTGHYKIAGPISFVGPYHGPSRYWLDLDAGTLLHGPVVTDLDADRSSRAIAMAGTGASTKLM